MVRELLMRETAMAMRFEKTLDARQAFIQHCSSRGREQAKISGAKKRNL
jgi:hypothetical protein